MTQGPPVITMPPLVVGIQIRDMTDNLDFTDQAHRLVGMSPYYAYHHAFDIAPAAPLLRFMDRDQAQFAFLEYGGTVLAGDDPKVRNVRYWNSEPRQVFRIRSIAVDFMPPFVRTRAGPGHLIVSSAAGILAEGPLDTFITDVDAPRLHHQFPGYPVDFVAVPRAPVSARLAFEDPEPFGRGMLSQSKVRFSLFGILAAAR